MNYSDFAEVLGAAAPIMEQRNLMIVKGRTGVQYEVVDHSHLGDTFTLLDVATGQTFEANRSRLIRSGMVWVCTSCDTRESSEFQCRCAPHG